jgi:hypothetical protein
MSTANLDARATGCTPKTSLCPRESCFYPQDMIKIVTHEYVSIDIREESDVDGRPLPVRVTKCALA